MGHSKGNYIYAKSKQRRADYIYTISVKTAHYTHQRGKQPLAHRALSLPQTLPRGFIPVPPLRKRFKNYREVIYSRKRRCPIARTTRALRVRPQHRDEPPASPCAARGWEKGGKTNTATKKPPVIQHSVGSQARLLRREENGLLSSAVATATRPRTRRSQAAPARARPLPQRFPRRHGHGQPRSLTDPPGAAGARLREKLIASAQPPPPACGSGSLGSPGAGRVSRRRPLHPPALGLRVHSSSRKCFCFPTPSLRSDSQTGRPRGRLSAPLREPAGHRGERGRHPREVHPAAGRRGQAQGGGLSPRPAALRGRGSGLRPLRRAEPPLRRRGRVPGEAEHRPPPRPSPESHRAAPQRAGGTAPPPLCSREKPPPAPPVPLPPRQHGGSRPLPDPPRRADARGGTAPPGTAPPRGPRRRAAPSPGHLPSREGAGLGRGGRTFPHIPPPPSPGASGRPLAGDLPGS